MLRQSRRIEVSKRRNPCRVRVVQRSGPLRAKHFYVQGTCCINPAANANGDRLFNIFIEATRRIIPQRYRAGRERGCEQIFISLLENEAIRGIIAENVRSHK